MELNLITMLNSQIQKEFESAYIYLDFAAFFDFRGLSGFANWYKIQAKEEEEHAMKLYDYLCSIDKPIELLPIPAPGKKFETIKQVLELGLEHEKYVSSLIESLYFQAEKEKNLFAKNFLEWFVKEQHEEEENAKELITKYELFGGSPEGLYSLNKELGKRE